MKTIALVNQKGGVGKTTVAFHLCCGLLERGLRVLAVDLDPQGNLSDTLHLRSCLSKKILVGEEEPELEVARTSVCDQPLDVVTSDGSLPRELGTRGIQPYGRLRRVLKSSMGRWDVVVIDTPVWFGTHTVNALVASDSVIVPVEPSMYSLLGLREVMKFMEMVRVEELNRELLVAGIVLNKYDAFGNNLSVVSRESDAGLRQAYPDMIFETKIPRGIAVEEAIQHMKPVWRYAPESRVATAYLAFVTEALRRTQFCTGETNERQSAPAA